MPFYDGNKREKYWVAFCLKGGHGVNKEGLALSDPGSLFMIKPQVGKDCVLDPNKYVSYAIPAPMNLQAVPSGSAWVDLSWEEPPVGTGPAIKNYRLFVSDPQNTYQGLTIETTDAKTTYRLNTPEPMHGKFYAATVQAINKVGKLS